MEKKGFLIWSLPRSMTSLLYTRLYQSFKKKYFKSPKKFKHKNASSLNGEVLNRSSLIFGEDRRLLPQFFNGERKDYLLRYSEEKGLFRRKWSEEQHQQAVQTGNSILKKFSEGYFIKTVTNPWVIQKYLDKNPQDYYVLIIERNLTDIALRLKEKGWTNVVNYSDLDLDKGLDHHICRAVYLIHKNYLAPQRENSIRVFWDDLIFNPDSLWEKLLEFDFFDLEDAFIWFKFQDRRRRDRKLEVRQSSEWKKMASIMETVSKMKVE